MRRDIENPMIMPFEPTPIGICDQSGQEIYEGDTYIEFGDDWILNDKEILADYVRCNGVLRG